MTSLKRKQKWKVLQLIQFDFSVDNEDNLTGKEQASERAGKGNLDKFNFHENLIQEGETAAVERQSRETKVN